MAVVVVLGNEDRVARVWVLVPTVGEEDDGADFGGASPEFAQEFTFQVDVFRPLVVFHFHRLGDVAPVEDRFDVGEFLLERGDLVIERNGDRS